MQHSPERKIIDLKVIDTRIGDTFEMPDYQTNGSAGIDLLACVDESITIEPGQTELILPWQRYYCPAQVLVIRKALFWVIWLA